MTENQWVDADHAQRRAASTEERQARRAARGEPQSARGGADADAAVDRDLDSETAEEMLSEAHTAGD